MSNTRKLIRDIKLWFALTLQLFLFPTAVYVPVTRAQEVIPETTTTDTVTPAPEPVEEPTPVVEQPTTTGPQQPTGPENTSYTYNPATGLWENPYYTWNPNTKQTTPKTDPNYSYNPNTGMWDTTSWVYVPESGGYKPQVSSSPGSPPASETQADSDAPAQITPQLKTTSSLLNDSNSNFGPGALQVTTHSNENNSYFDGFFNANISVSVNSNAQSGNASVLQNTIGGSALSGDASVMANILNMVQSGWGVGGLLPYMYTENIQGDYFGDIFLDPGLLAVTNSNLSNSEMIVNSTQDVSIDNDIDLVAQSGDALVAKNTQAGDATSGDASVILNLMNMINSSISTGQSFIGMLNIYGNLDGDVLMPDNLLDTLVASNIPTSQIELGSNVDTSFMVDNNNSHSIDNSINATASSGDAYVGMNTEAGDATSGNADTNITVFNLVGNHVVAGQAMLVFVNVQGTWVGFITNAPEGSTAAMLGGDVSSNNSQTSAIYDIDNSSSISNDIDLTAATGSASVLQNTTAGSATTGDASVVANITNISNSTFSLSNWFGMLFINIFGNWNGSFGTDTAFGDTPITNNQPPATNTANPTTTGSGAAPQATRVFAVTIAPNSSGGTSITSATPVLEEDVPPPSVLSSNEDKTVPAIFGDTDSTTPTSGFNPIIWGSLLLVVITAILYRRRFALQQ